MKTAGDSLNICTMLNLIVNPMCENFMKQLELIEIHYFFNVNFNVVNRNM